MGRLSGKTAFVTGAGGGIGRAIAFSLAREGATVAAADINDQLLSETAELAGDLAITTVKCDVANRTEVFAKIDGFARQAGGLDILVNNAVMFHYAPLVDFDPQIGRAHSELQSPCEISYAVFCLKKKKWQKNEYKNSNKKLYDILTDCYAI